MEVWELQDFYVWELQDFDEWVLQDLDVSQLQGLEFIGSSRFLCVGTKKKDDVGVRPVNIYVQVSWVTSDWEAQRAVRRAMTPLA